MLSLRYSNKNGRILLSGDDRTPVRIISIKGLGLPKKNYKTVEFASENGVTQISEKDMVRTITISAELVGDKRDCRNISRVFHEPGELYITSDDIRRKIKCKCIQPPEFNRLGQSIGIYTFTVQLQADYPYYTEFYDINHPVFKLENVVVNDFTLPSVFTKRVSRTIVNNTGDKKIYPKMNILNLSKEPDTASVNTDEMPENCIVIKNHSTGAQIMIHHVMRLNENICIDMETRKIISNIDGNITNKIDDDTRLSDFFVDIGENDIEFINTNTINQNLSAVLTYSPEYFSAEI